MMGNCRLVMSLLIVISYSCTNLNDLGPIDDTSVLCVIVANQDPQRFFIYRTASLNEPDAGFVPFEVKFSQFFIDNASVAVNDVLKAYPFKLQLDTLGGAIVRKSFVPESLLTVQPGGAYSLSVVRGSTVIQGATRVPGNFSIIRPLDGQVFSGLKRKLRIEFAWTSSDNSQCYSVNITQYYRTPLSLIPQTHSFDVFDTLFTMPYDLDVYSPDSLNLEIYSFDKNYYHHRFKSVARSGITGGYGYFGSAVLKKLVVYVN